RLRRAVLYPLSYGGPAMSRTLAHSYSGSGEAPRWARSCFM
ncbi:MAG: hypothetical protein QOF00_1438, partial [Pseudonocardiales bacterium]|nr:hypothetical protein [Pseudonocardiales bacterium]